MLAPVIVAAAALGIAVAYSAESGCNPPMFGVRTADVVTGTHVVIAAAMAAGLLRLRHVRGAVIDLVKQLGGVARPERIGDALAQVLDLLLVICYPKLPPGHLRGGMSHRFVQP